MTIERLNDNQENRLRRIERVLLGDSEAFHDGLVEQFKAQNEKTDRLLKKQDQEIEDLRNEVDKLKEDKAKQAYLIKWLWGFVSFFGSTVAIGIVNYLLGL